MTESNQETGKTEREEIGRSGDYVGGDKVTVRDISKSAVAIGEGAQAVLNYFEAPEESLDIWSGVPPKPPYLLGRDALIRDLNAQLVSGPGQALAIQGLPGVGKTTLAVALTNQKEVLEQFKDGVLWASLGPEAKKEDVVEILKRWGDALGLDLPHNTSLAERKLAVGNAIGQNALLIVIDDAWEYGLARHLRFGNPNSRHLLTTRDQEVAAQFVGVGGTTIEAPTLEEAPALQLLQKFAPEASAADPEAVQALAQAVGGLPLALELLGGYLALPKHKLRPKLGKAALEELMDPRRRLQLAQERLGKSGQQETLQEAITLSIEGLRELDNGADLERAFYSLGAFAPKPEQFSWEAAEAVTKAEIEDLVLRNLLEISGDQLAIHQVIADVARTKIDQPSILRHRDFYLELVMNEWDDWHCIRMASGQINRAWEFLPMMDDLLELLQEKTGDRAVQAATLVKIATIYDNLGQPAIAINPYMQALSIYEELGDRYEQAVILNNIGLDLENMGQPDEALEIYVQALPLLEEVGNREVQAAVLHNIGAIHANHLREWDKAVDYYEQALVINKETGHEWGLANILNKKGVAHAVLEQWEEALENYNEALLLRKALGDRDGEASTLYNIAVVYTNHLGQAQKGLDLFNQALSISEETGDRAGQAETLTRIGELYLQLGQKENALEHFKQALAITEEANQRYWQATLLHQIALVYHSMGQLGEALAVYNEALPLLDEAGDWAGLSETMFNMALILYHLGSLGDAAALLRQVVEFDRMSQHPDSLKHNQALAQIEAELAASAHN